MCTRSYDAGKCKNWNIKYSLKNQKTSKWCILSKYQNFSNRLLELLTLCKVEYVKTKRNKYINFKTAEKDDSEIYK